MRYDAVVVGGSFAGLPAALQLARARRNVLVVDAFLPRNRFSNHSHGLIGHDGRSASDILCDARAQIAKYPSVTLLRGEVTSARASTGGFQIAIDGGFEAFGRRLLLATGVTDVLPEIPGLRERWGKTVLHCPYCHGFEIGGGSIGVLAMGPMSIHQASLIADWGDVTFFTNSKG